MDDGDKLLPNDEAAKRIYQEPNTLATWRCRGKGPKFLKIGRGVFYRESALREWLKAQERDPAARRAQ